MLRLCLLLIPAAMAVALPLTWLVIRLGHRLRAFDSAGVAGQIKAPPRRVPNTGGVAIFWAIALPMLGAIALVWHDHGSLVTRLVPTAAPYLAGLREQTPQALALLASLLVLHILGLIDDRRPMGPWIKLAIMAAPALAIPTLFPSTRLVTLLDAHVGGAWLSIALTALWFLVVTNALNFMDNMDGLSAGVAAVAAGFFMVAAVIQPQPQWFVAACLALLIGSCLGFLAFNFPALGPARVFMGDGGSLVLGFLLAFLTVRTTYIADAPRTVELAGGGSTTILSAVPWYAILMPIVVLAVPLYDLASVVVIRLSQGRSPFVGDMQHLSHRLVNLGLTRRAAVGVIYGLTAVTGITGVVLGTLAPWQAILAGAQVVLVLLVLAMFEYARAVNRPSRGSKSPERATASTELSS
jgi:UDP-GlcNAc:undecaprenyl-phosphate GlcNAc-1-phosphate transferase